MTRKSVVVVALACVMGTLAAYSCTSRECGVGTADKQGVCIADDSVGGVLCGTGTHLNQATMLCEPDVYTCDPDTADVNDAGVCVGRITGSLPQPLPCPVVADDEICVSGWIRDFDNKGQPTYGKDTLITDESTEIWVFDPFQVLLCTQAPCMVTADAISGPYYPAADGTFLLDADTQGRKIKATGSFIALGVKNRDATPHGDSDWTEAGITADGKGGITIENFDLFAVGKAQVAEWHAAYPGLVDKGVFITLWHWLDTGEADYAKNRTFIEGVLPNRSPGAIDITSLYFMTDDRNTLEVGSAGGVNVTTAAGGVLQVQEALTPHSATGGFVPGSAPPVSITWESRQGASVPGLVFLQFFNQKLQ
jgi:hypothetical protein